MLKPLTTVELYQKSPSPQTWKKGEVIFSQGEPGNVMYAIICGEVEMWVDGKIVETIKPGDVFGCGVLVHLDHKRDSTAICKTECTLAFLDREHFLFAVEQTPMFALEVMRSYSDRLRYVRHLL